jgi:predicted DCC family thiol-disulfide oxidoreductase YuxK
LGRALPSAGPDANVGTSYLSETNSNPIIFYDGVCGLCNRLVQFVLKHDKRDYFRFAALQSDLASTTLLRHNRDPHDLDTVYVVVEYGQPAERLLARSDAILFLLKHLGGIWKLAALGKILPRTLRDATYELVARNRYRVFGKYESCMLPDPKHRAKFLDQ